MKHGLATRTLLAAVGVVSLASNASALPGFFATPGGEAKSRSSQVVVMKNGDQSVVSVMTDYDGPTENFALVIPVPNDVGLDGVKALKRVDVERLEELTAPRFHEFWEMNPCEPGQPEQIWEMSRAASSDTDFLGAGEMLAGTTKAPPEMRIEVEPEFRSDSEYQFSLVGSNLEGFLKGKGLRLPEGVSGKLSNYGKFLVAEVDARRLEVGAKGEAMLSPIRFATRQEVVLATSLGAAHTKGQTELLVFVLDPKEQYQVSGHENVYPPTNYQVALEVKEKTGEFYAALHDKHLAKAPDAFLVEYAWSTKGCGEPCPQAPLHLAELLTLGGDVHEANVPEAERNPAPPERSAEEQAVYDAAKPDEKKKMDELAKEVARRKVLIARQSDYVLTRLHHRYATIGDLRLAPAASMKGGVETPKGQAADLPQGVSASDKPMFQTRIVTLHRNKVAVECPAPEFHRWGKPPAEYRGARKIWVADRLAARDRKKVKPEEVLYTPIAALGIQGVAPPGDLAAAAAASAQAEQDAKASNCDCRTVGGTASPTWAALLGVVLGACGLFVRRRRPSRA